MSTPPPIPGPSSGPSFIPLALPQDPQEPPLFHCCSRSIPPVSSFPDPCLLPHTPSVSPDPSSHSAFNAEVHFHISQFELQLESTNNCLESTTTLLTTWQAGFHGEQVIWAQWCRICDFQIASRNTEVGHLHEQLVAAGIPVDDTEKDAGVVDGDAS